MKVSVQVIVHSNDDTGASSVVREVLTLDRDGMALRVRQVFEKS